MTIALFPILVVLAMVSSLSWMIIKGYVYTIAYLQMWPLLFSILNHAMNFYLQGKLNGTAVTLATFDQVQNTYSDIGTTAGWLALSIPFIAWGLVKGLGQGGVAGGELPWPDASVGLHPVVISGCRR
ncbi:conjugal transfer protein TraG N-terminal domain-containing protein [Citrobacter freundii]|nr:conjugal transfer protein TraG N-terminal domain-containing protein [Citrobacter freundii]